jgi:hypothetical protein
LQDAIAESVAMQIIDVLKIVEVYKEECVFEATGWGIKRSLPLMP